MISWVFVFYVVAVLAWSLSKMAYTQAMLWVLNDTHSVVGAERKEKKARRRQV